MKYTYNYELGTERQVIEEIGTAPDSLVVIIGDTELRHPFKAHAITDGIIHLGVEALDIPDTSEIEYVLISVEDLITHKHFLKEYSFHFTHVYSVFHINTPLSDRDIKTFLTTTDDMYVIAEDEEEKVDMFRQLSWVLLSGGAEFTTKGSVFSFNGILIEFKTLHSVVLQDSRAGLL